MRVVVCFIMARISIGVSGRIASLFLSWLTMGGGNLLTAGGGNQLTVGKWQFVEEGIGGSVQPPHPQQTATAPPSANCHRPLSTDLSYVCMSMPTSGIHVYIDAYRSIYIYIYIYISCFALRAGGTIDPK